MYESRRHVFLIVHLNEVRKRQKGTPLLIPCNYYLTRKFNKFCMVDRGNFQLKSSGDKAAWCNELTKIALGLINFARRSSCLEIRNRHSSALWRSRLLLAHISLSYPALRAGFLACRTFHSFASASFPGLLAFKIL